jgi:ferredoxin
VAGQLSFDSRCPKYNLLAHQQADAATLKTDLESDEFRLYCIRCDYCWKPSPTGKLNILKGLP